MRNADIVYEPHKKQWGFRKYRHYSLCESRVEQKRSEGGGNTPEDMKEQARQGVDHRGSLDVGEAVEPVEKTLNGLTDRADKCRERVIGNQSIAFLLFSWGKQLQSKVPLERLCPVSVNINLIGIYSFPGIKEA